MSVVFMCRGCGDLSENNNKSIRENVLFEERRVILFQISLKSDFVLGKSHFFLFGCDLFVFS